MDESSPVDSPIKRSSAILSQRKETPFPLTTLEELEKYRQLKASIEKERSRKTSELEDSHRRKEEDLPKKLKLSDTQVAFVGNDGEYELPDYGGGPPSPVPSKNESATLDHMR